MVGNTKCPVELLRGPILSVTSVFANETPSVIRWLVPLPLAVSAWFVPNQHSQPLPSFILLLFLFIILWITMILKKNMEKTRHAVCDLVVLMSVWKQIFSPRACACPCPCDHALELYSTCGRDACRAPFYIEKEKVGKKNRKALIAKYL